jgi:hypothetical protein
MRNLLSFVRKSRAEFQALSHLHLEIGNQYQSLQIPVTAASHLVLAGDIGRLADEGYAEFLYRHTAQFETIFLVLGSHEFYGISHDQGLDKARDVAEQDRMKGKAIFLDRGSYEIPNSNVTILGCTLWSNIPESKEEICWIAD